MYVAAFYLLAGLALYYFCRGVVVARARALVARCRTTWFRAHAGYPEWRRLRAGSFPHRPFLPLWDALLKLDRVRYDLRTGALPFHVDRVTAVGFHRRIAPRLEALFDETPSKGPRRAGTSELPLAPLRELLRQGVRLSPPVRGTSNPLRFDSLGAPSFVGAALMSVTYRARRGDAVETFSHVFFAAEGRPTPSFPPEFSPERDVIVWEADAAGRDATDVVRRFCAGCGADPLVDPLVLPLALLLEGEAGPPPASPGDDLLRIEFE